MFGYTEDEILDSVITYDPRTGHDDYTLPLAYTIDELDQFCLYVLTFNVDAITRSALTNMKTMFEMIDLRPYLLNDLSYARIEFIKLGLKARLDENLSKRVLVKLFIQKNCDPKYADIIKEILDQFTSQKMPNDDCKMINTMIYDNLISGWSISYSKEMTALLDKKDAGGYHRISDFKHDFQKLLDRATEEMRKSEEYLREGKGFDLDADTIHNVISTRLENLKAPTNKLRTGIQYFNKMLNGGFESGRSYLIAGISGVGKSIVLMTCALQMKMYNKLPVEDGMRLAVLFISQENSIDESVERIFNITGTGEDIREFTEEQVVQSLADAGVLSHKDKPDEIGFIFRYYTDKEIGVTDIDALIADYERSGIRIIAVVQDYIEKLKPKFNYNELRYSLGSIATELSELAKKWKIPVISAAQLNRVASSIVTDAVANNKTNTIKLLGKNQFSESWDMIKNVDSAIIINREIDDTQENSPEYMGFKLDKYRGKPNKDRIIVFLHPFDPNNGICLTPDINGAPLSRFTIEEFNPMYKRRAEHILTRDERDMEESQEKFLDYCSKLVASDDDDDGLVGNNFLKLYQASEEERKLSMEQLSNRDTELRLRLEQERRSASYDDLPRDEEGFILMVRSKQTNTEEGT